jgi:3-oxoacyl-[acyl-carrier-protein] synthase-1
MRLPIVASGMVTPVGFHAASSCAAIRVGIDGFQETRFEFDGDFIRGGVVSVDDVASRDKLAWMAVSAVDQCLTRDPRASREDTAIALCVAELERPGRFPGLDDALLAQVCSRVEQPERLGAHRKLFQSGTLGAVQALVWADEIFTRGAADHCVVAGVDSYLSGPTLASFHAAGRLLTAKNSDGFIPGEAAAGVLLSRSSAAPVAVECVGIGWGQEPALPGSGEPLRADGLTQAYRAALQAAGCGFPALDYRLADIAGEQYAFKEAALALLRTMRVRKEAFTIWHPADCVGRVGAASVPLVLGVALAAARKSYSPGPGALCHFTDDTGLRAAAVLRERDTRTPTPTHQGDREPS